MSNAFVWLSVVIMLFSTAPLSAEPVPTSFEPILSELVSFADGRATTFEPRPDQWDAAFRERGSIVRLDDGTLRLYYTGYDGTREGIKQIGLAFSTNIIQTGRRHETRSLV